MEVGVEQRRKLIERRMRQNQRNAARRPVLPHQRILCQEVAAFGVALPQQLGIARAVARKLRIVTGGAQVAAQPAKHLVAQEAGHGVHGSMLHRELLPV